jgi:hypothetical protein
MVFPTLMSVWAVTEIGRPKVEQVDNSTLLRDAPDHFVYKPLAPRDTTRMLVLDPGSFGDPLTGSIEHVQDVHDCTYDALSYVWGKERSNHTISVIFGFAFGRNEISLSPNLHAALQRLRSPHKSRNLWVDAICINQKDSLEKSTQVENMREIFANAEKVVVWLGEEEKHDELALSALRRLNSHVNQWDQVDPFPRLGWGRDEEGNPWTRGTKARALPSIEERNLELLLNREWFRRSWVVQEVATARKVDIQYGTKAVPWEIFNGLYHETLDRFAKDGIGSDLARRACENITTMENGRRSHHGLMSMDLFDVLLATNANECTDPRDKIYSMLGLARDWLQKKGLRPDYSDDATLEYVFKRFALWDTKMNLKIRILSCASGPCDSKGIFAILGAGLDEYR